MYIHTRTETTVVEPLIVGRYHDNAQGQGPEYSPVNLRRYRSNF